MKQETIKRYIIKIHHKGIFGRTDIINVIDKGDETKGDFYSYESGCFRLYYNKNGKEYNLSIPLDTIDSIEIGEA